jgi:hypothetical protein
MSFVSVTKDITIGRPRYTNPSMRKSKSMTICLTHNCYDKFVLLSDTNRQPPARMARMIIEKAVDSINEGDYNVLTINPQ